MDSVLIQQVTSFGVFLIKVVTMTDTCAILSPGPHKMDNVITQVRLHIASKIQAQHSPYLKSISSPYAFRSSRYNCRYIYIYIYTSIIEHQHSAHTHTHTWKPRRAIFHATELRNLQAHNLQSTNLIC